MQVQKERTIEEVFDVTSGFDAESLDHLTAPSDENPALILFLDQETGLDVQPFCFALVRVANRKLLRQVLRLGGAHGKNKAEP